MNRNKVILNWSVASRLDHKCDAFYYGPTERLAKASPSTSTSQSGSVDPITGMTGAAEPDIL